MVKKKIKIRYPRKLINMYPNTTLAVLRDKGYLKYVDGEPTYTQKGFKHIRKK